MYFHTSTSSVFIKKLTTVNKFDWLRTGESHQTEQNYDTEPAVHVSECIILKQGKRKLNYKKKKTRNKS